MDEDNNNEKDKGASPSEKDNLKELSLEEILDLSLMDNDFFVFAAEKRQDFVDVLIKPALNYLGIIDYKIVSVASEVNYSNLKSHGVRIDCLVKLQSGEYILIEIQNGHPERMPLKRIRYEQSSLDTRHLKQGEPYDELPDIISLIYTTEPLEGLDTGNTLNDLAAVDLKSGQIASDFGIRVLIVNGKYKTEEDQAFSDVIEDLQKHHPDNVKNPVMKEIHNAVKKTEKGKSMLSDYIEERYGGKIRKLEEQHLKDEKEIKEDKERIQKLEKLLKDNGIKYD